MGLKLYRIYFAVGNLLAQVWLRDALIIIIEVCIGQRLC